ncbi:uncharacterized protein LOC130903861 [Diorhabda carinulata]|uniref:uncharacterized protein LOC130903861 n=1 Tax=Diorhabda carinulata TaxID=1163345 RepID=UPI00259FED3B|nr:uncharacterized protein LOC130903861 [Diorhabda carinulata]
MDFHPSDVPIGMKPYNLKEITHKQQEQLNRFKLEQIRKNHRYLKAHPEIKCITSTLLRAILKTRPTYEIKEFFTRYVVENRSKLEELIENTRSGVTKSETDLETYDEAHICKFDIDEVIWMKRQPALFEMYKGLQELSCGRNSIRITDDHDNL